MCRINIDDIDSIPVLGPKPEQVPPGAIVWNAPRPLFGSIIDDDIGALTWEGDFLSGRFYAAVDTVNDDLAESWIFENKRLNGVIVEYLDPALMRPILQAWYRLNFNDRETVARIVARVEIMPEKQLRSTLNDKLYRKPYGMLRALMADAKTMQNGFERQLA